MNDFKPIIRVRIWLENENGDVVFGSGRSTLIEKIDEYGSLKKAAQNMRISYRAAWGKIKETESILGNKLIDKTKANRDGYHLTEFGKKLNALYKLWFEKVEEHAIREAKDVFPWICRTYKESSVNNVDN